MCAYVCECTCGLSSIVSRDVCVMSRIFVYYCGVVASLKLVYKDIQ